MHGSSAKKVSFSFRGEIPELYLLLFPETLAVSAKIIKRRLTGILIDSASSIFYGLDLALIT